LMRIITSCWFNNTFIKISNSFFWFSIEIGWEIISTIILVLIKITIVKEKT